MEALWRWGALSIREITTGIRGPDRRPAYSTVQTMVYRLEARGAVRRVEKIRNYHVFEAAVTREIAEGQHRCRLPMVLRRTGLAFPRAFDRDGNDDDGRSKKRRAIFDGCGAVPQRSRLVFFVGFTRQNL